jgi:hypothetical protein
MAVATNNDRAISIVASAGQTALDLDFRLMDGVADVKVTRKRAAVITALAANADYTVATLGNGNASVVLTVPALAGDIYDCVGERPLGRALDQAQRGNLTASDVNREFDSLAIQIQEIGRAAGADIPGLLADAQAAATQANASAISASAAAATVATVAVAAGVDLNTRVTTQRIVMTDPVNGPAGAAGRRFIVEVMADPANGSILEQWAVLVDGGADVAGWLRRRNAAGIWSGWVALASAGASYPFTPTESVLALRNVVAADAGKVLLCSGTFTVALGAAASLGNGFPVTVRNAGAGVITIDPAGAETVNGLATLAIYPGETAQLVCDGTNWRALGLADEIVLAKAVTTVAAVDVELSLPAGFTSYSLRCENFRPSAAAEIFARFRVGGSLLVTGYWWHQYYFSASPGPYASSTGTVNSTGISFAVGNGAPLGPDPSALTAEISPGDATTFGGIQWRYFASIYHSLAFGRPGTAGRLEAIQLRCVSPATVQAGLTYSLTGRRT